MRTIAFFAFAISLLIVGCSPKEHFADTSSSGSGGGGDVASATSTTAATTGGGGDGGGGGGQGGDGGGGQGGGGGTGGGGPACVDASDCDDADACTTDACNAGVCEHEVVDADDGDACTVDACDAALGVTHTAVDPDDGDACTVDACDPTTGESHVAVDPDDGDACTDDTCDAALGVQNTPTDLDDLNACTVDACDAMTGPSHTAIAVDDGNACTTDACDPMTGVSHVAINPNDNNVCTTDTCDPVTGVSNKALIIDDSNACTTDACDPVTGISHTPVNIDDANACTTDACTPAGGVTHTPVNVSDNDVCTTDTCDPVLGIKHAPINVSDNDPCTADACNPVSGVSHTPIYDPSAFAMTELNIGGPDYLIVTNTSTCPNSLAGFQVVFDDASSTDVTTVLPSQVLPAGGTLKITDQVNPPAPEIYAGANIAFSPSTGGATLLCNGSCTAAANVVDAVAYTIGAPHPPLPSGVTFSPGGLSGVTSQNQFLFSFHRVAFSGAAPSFLASDWKAGTPCNLNNMRIVEVNIGTPDYAVIHNTAICALSLSGLQMLFDDSSLTDTTTVLPAQTLQPGEAVRVTEGTLTGTDIASGSIVFSSTRGGNTLLCNGSCAVGANVIDAMSFDGGAVHTALPSPVTFTPAGASGIDSATENTLSFVRKGYSGVAPTFVQSDWGTGPLCSDPKNLRIVELAIGSPDYIVLENPGFCEVSLGGMEVLFDDSSSGDLTTMLPTQPLASQTRVVVKESPAGVGEIDALGNIPFSSTRGGATLLCTGSCTTAANVVDVVAFSTGAAFPPLPAGITFSTGLLGITTANESSLSWLRGSRFGQNPFFYDFDWYVGPGSQ